ncbi:MAG: signal peptidase I [Clostridia bacterium]|nr:signal peptidase I [Clostridia bacterium]
MEYKDAPVLSFRPIDAKETKPKNVARLVRLHALIRLIVLALLVMLIALTFLIRPVRVKSGAMETAYPAGCVVFVTPEWGTPERGEVAAFTDPADGTGEIFVRRVVAVGLDTVEIRNGILLVNGIAAEEPYLSDGAKTDADMPETTVPEGCVFVLGDDRTANEEIGAIDLRQILGVVRFSFGR